MDWRALLKKPWALGAVAGGVVVVVVIVVFVGALGDYLEVQKYLARLRDHSFNVHDLNKYKRTMSEARQRLDELRRDTRVEFRQSDLFRRMIDMARRSNIPENDLSISRVGSSRRGDLEELALELRAFTTYGRLGAFVARLERAAPNDSDRFEFVLRVDRVDLAARKRSGAELSAKLWVTVYRKAGIDD